MKRIKYEILAFYWHLEHVFYIFWPNIYLFSNTYSTAVVQHHVDWTPQSTLHISEMLTKWMKRSNNLIAQAAPAKFASKKDP